MIEIPRSEIREAVLEGMSVELRRDAGFWVGTIEGLEHEVVGDTAAEVFRALAQIVEAP
jgi:hypothetical protein